MTYNQIVLALNDYMHRTDPETLTNAPVAMEMALLKLSRWFYPEPAAQVVPLAFVSNGDGTASVTVPFDLGQADTLYVGGIGDLEYLTARQFARRWADDELRGAYTITGSTIKAAASLATATRVTLTYYRAITAILPTESNWCSDTFPDVWLWQAIAEQHRFVQDAESAQLAEAYAEELGNAAMDQTRANVAGGALRMSSR